MLCDFVKPSRCGVVIEREWEVSGDEAAEEEVAVGDGERAAATVAGRAGVGAGAVGSDDELDTVEAADGAAAGSDRFDGQHGGDDADAGFFGFELILVAAVVAGDVGAGAAHVEADGLGEAGGLGDFRKTDDAAGGTGEEGVFAGEGGGGGEAAGGGHEAQRGCRLRIAECGLRSGGRRLQIVNCKLQIGGRLFELA